MSKRVVELFIVDLLVAMEKIERYHSDAKSAESFYHDEKSFDATMRELQIIGEATKHLISTRHLSEEHRIIVDFRNLIVHEYFGIDADEIWDILHHELPVFKQTIYEIIEKADKAKLLKIIDDTKSDSRGNTYRFLEELFVKVKGLKDR